MKEPISLTKPNPKRVNQELAEILEFKYGDESFNFKYHQHHSPLKTRLYLALKAHFPLAICLVGILLWQLNAPLSALAGIAYAMLCLTIGVVAISGLVSIICLFVWWGFLFWGYHKHALIPRKINWAYVGSSTKMEYRRHHPRSLASVSYISYSQTLAYSTLLSDPHFDLAKCLKAADKAHKKMLRENKKAQLAAAAAELQASRNIALLNNMSAAIATHSRDVVQHNIASIEVHEDTYGKV